MAESDTTVTRDRALTSANANTLKRHLNINTISVYERRFPGNAYVTVEVERLQAGCVKGLSTIQGSLDKCRLVSLYFVFHPSSNVNRFKGASITLTLRPKSQVISGRLPRFLQLEPHVLFGAVTPETLDWSFNLSGTLGVSSVPASASVNPSYTQSSSYKRYEMMTVQGSTRLFHDRQTGQMLEHGQVWWTMNENSLQKSGLPREFTFVVLVDDGDSEQCEIGLEIQADVAAWFGSYPDWWCDLRYPPLLHKRINLDREVGSNSAFGHDDKPFNFAEIQDMANYIAMPGNVYKHSTGPT